MFAEETCNLFSGTKLNLVMAKKSSFHLLDSKMGNLCCKITSLEVLYTLFKCEFSQTAYITHQLSLLFCLQDILLTSL